MANRLYSRTALARARSAKVYRQRREAETGQRSESRAPADNITEMHPALGLAAEAGYSMALPYAPVAQLDRVSASEAEGRRFESCRVRHLRKRSIARPVAIISHSLYFASAMALGTALPGYIICKHESWSVQHL